MAGVGGAGACHGSQPLAKAPTRPPTRQSVVACLPKRDVSGAALHSSGELPPLIVTHYRSLSASAIGQMDEDRIFRTCPVCALFQVDHALPQVRVHSGVDYLMLGIPTVVSTRV